MDGLPINLGDLIVFVTIGLAAIIGLLAGFVYAILWIAAWAGAIAVAILFYPVAEPFAAELIGAGLFASVGAGLALFLVSLVVFIIGAYLVSKAVRASALGALDRTLGLIFGLGCGFLAISALWLGYAWLIPPQDRPAWIIEARSLSLVKAGAETLASLLPEDYQRRLEDEGATGSDQPFVPPIQPGTGEGSGSANGGATEYNEQDRQQLEQLIEQRQ
ncbi:CvpA family protein [Algihabitans albus]|uniref:CvpA family protein n=1 Tax=Algihabitans albus TaxID=2164067 RepID=UPI000E5D0EB7|nr:CvpA family protein [Algihabitans albus]